MLKTIFLHVVSIEFVLEYLSNHLPHPNRCGIFLCVKLKKVSEKG